MNESTHIWTIYDIQVVYKHHHHHHHLRFQKRPILLDIFSIFFLLLFAYTIPNDVYRYILVVVFIWPFFSSSYSPYIILQNTRIILMLFLFTFLLPFFFSLSFFCLIIIWFGCHRLSLFPLWTMVWIDGVCGWGRFFGTFKCLSIGRLCVLWQR